MKCTAAVREGGGGHSFARHFWPVRQSYFERYAPDGTGRAVAANLAVAVTIRAGLSPVSPAFSKSFGDTRSLTPQGFAADSGVCLQLSNSFCTERTGVDRLRRPQIQTGRGSPGFEGRRQRVFEGGVRDALRPGIVAPAASVRAAGKRGTLRLGQRRGGSHPRVFPTLGAPKGGHTHTEIQGAGSAVTNSDKSVGGARQGGHTRSGMGLSCRRDRNDFCPGFELVEVVRPLLHHRASCLDELCSVVRPSKAVRDRMR